MRTVQCLVLTRSTDRHADIVVQELLRRDVSVYRLNVGDVDCGTRLSIIPGQNGVTVHGSSGPVSLPASI
jgi:hypothetical protein